ncbi:MAG TPA: hypothetical protein VF503_18490, partial [Sphingobium sp.]
MSHRIRFIASVAFAACSSMALASGTPELVDPTKFQTAGKVSPEFFSYNVEMASVIGGNFWRPYTATNPAPSPVASGGDDLLTSNLGSMLRARPPLDLTNRRLRTLAAALGPANV